MKLSTKSEYACLALIYLSAKHASGSLCTISDIAVTNGIPKKYLEQILLMLKRNGYVRSHKGSEGGYKLAKEPGLIHLAEIIRCMDGALAPVESVSKYFYEPTPIERNQKMIAIFRDIRDYISNKLESITLADLIER